MNDPRGTNELQPRSGISSPPIAMKSPSCSTAAWLLLGAAATAQNLTPAAFLPGTLQTTPTPGAQQVSAASLGSSSTLLVWDDARAGTFDIYGIRIDGAGQPLDAQPFPICSAAGDQRKPRVAWNGQAWLVAFDSNAPVGGYFTHQVGAVRVAANGTVLDAAPITFSSDQSAHSFGVASDGNNWVITSAGTTAGNAALRARRISAAGQVLDHAGIVMVPEGSSILFNADLAYSSGVFLATWGDASGTRGVRFNSQLTKLDANPKVLASSGPGRIAAGPSQFFLAFERPGWYIYTDVVGTRIDLAGNVLDTTPIPVAPNQYYGPSPTPTWTGSQWMVAWLSGVQTSAARVSAAGVVLDPSGITLTAGGAGQYSPSIGALPGGSAIVTWDDIRNLSDDVYGNTVSAAGIAGTETLWSKSPETLSLPMVATGPGQYVVTYKAAGANSSRILAQRVRKDGSAIDVQPIEVASASNALLSTGGCAWNGSVYLIVWADGQQSKILARRMDSTGIFLDASPIVVLSGWAPDVAALQGDFLVSGLRSTGYPQYVDSFATRVRGTDGAVLDNPNLWIGTTYATRTRLTTLDGRWLAVTESHNSHNDSQYGILATFVTPAGSVSSQMVVGNGIAGGANWGKVDVASSGSSALIVYHSGSNWVNSDVLASRLLPNGTLSHIAVNLTSAAASGQSAATALWNGKTYFVAFQSLQNNPENYDLEPDVYAVRLGENGDVLDPVGWPLWTTEQYEQDPIGRGYSNGPALFACSAFDPVQGAFRISARALRPEGVDNYGTGTPGCFGPQNMDVSGIPAIGDASFSFVTSLAPPTALGLGLLSTIQDLAGSDPFGIQVILHVGLLGAPEVLPFDMVSDATMTGNATLGIPNVPALVGNIYYAQSLWAWTSICNPSLYGLSTSNGLRIVVQAP